MDPENSQPSKDSLEVGARTVAFASLRGQAADATGPLRARPSGLTCQDIWLDGGDGGGPCRGPGSAGRRLVAGLWGAAPVAAAPPRPPRWSSTAAPLVLHSPAEPEAAACFGFL